METDPKQIHLAAGRLLDALDAVALSDIEKIAALQVAASTIDHALNAQSRAIMVANMIRGSLPKP